MLLVATFDPTAAPPRSHVPLLAGLQSGATRFSLIDLPPSEFATLARDLGFEGAAVAAVATRLHELSLGNPGAAVELACWLRSRDRLDQLAARRTSIRSLPPALVERYSQRLAPRSAAERGLLEAVALLQGEVRELALRELLGLPETEFTPLLAALMASGLVVNDGGALACREPLLLRHVLLQLDPERRRALHGLAARHWLRAHESPGAAPRAALRAAIHAERADDRATLARTLRPGVRFLDVEGTPQRAYDLVVAAEELARREPADVALLAQALVLRGPLAHRLGLREDERATWQEAARLSTQQDDAGVRSHAFHGLGRLASRTGKFLAAESHLRTADLAAQAAPRGAGAERALILLDLAEAHLWNGDEERAAKVLDEAAAVIDAGAPIASIGRYWKERGNLLLELERFDEAGQAFAQGRAIVRGPALRPLHRALVLGAARLARERCEWDKARRACELAQASAESDLDRRHLAQALYVHGDVEARAGRPDAAFRPFVRAYRIAVELDDGYLAVSALGSLALLYRWRRFSGRSVDKAIRCARNAISRAHGLAVGRLEARGLAALALCYRDMKKLPWAMAIARKAVRQASAANVERRRAAEIHWVHGLIASESGDDAAAAASIGEARRRVERRLAGVASAATRARMAAEDPLLREVLAGGRPR